MAKQSKGGGPSMTVEEAIALGLRAQLVSESLVTGLLYIELDFHPGTPATLVNDPSIKYPEIPTLPTALERVEVQASEIGPGRIAEAAQRSRRARRHRAEPERGDRRHPAADGDSPRRGRAARPAPERHRRQGGNGTRWRARACRAGIAGDLPARAHARRSGGGGPVRAHAR